MELDIISRKLLLGGIYRPPDSNNQHWLLLEQCNGKVIHLSPNPDNATGKFNLIDIKGDTSVRIDDLRVVAGDSMTYRNNELDDELKPYSKTEIVKRAKRKLGTLGYDLMKYNCEHFATECRYGQARSKQVEAIEQKAYDWITPPFYRAWQTGDVTKFLAPPVNQVIDKVFYSPPGDLVTW
ncbi:phospholipase A and acyltransferase 2-like [Ruditapes philippinarum]|uniref:phospholipase A and acyltransferase 2-like n=1 Tax=Ruditapes philippinarum TaxID=129788 RepID=UPI00295B8988|nr:phospholipase A and acyltransferase 2-like [Ruditapes philippinarum]